MKGRRKIKTRNQNIIIILLVVIVVMLSALTTIALIGFQSPKKDVEENIPTETPPIFGDDDRCLTVATQIRDILAASLVDGFEEANNIIITYNKSNNSLVIDGNKDTSIIDPVSDKVESLVTVFKELKTLKNSLSFDKDNQLIYSDLGYHVIVRLDGKPLVATK